MTDEIQFSREGAWGVITLTRPKALNSLTRAMCLEIDRYLTECEADDSVFAVLVEGEGERAFCAGGDIRSLYNHGREGAEEASGFFRDEYRMNARIAAYTKPYVALMDGICMGGGVGLSLSASHRIVTERTMWAMPECGIGLIPDVGATYMLPRLRGGLGLYLGLTGQRLTGSDCVYAELATHLVPTDDLTAVRQVLLGLDLNADAHEEINAAMGAYRDAGDSALAADARHIDQFFSDVVSIPALIDELRQTGGDFSDKVLKAIEGASPTSLFLTVEALRGAPDSFNACISREFNVAAHLMASHDFHEGVRAQIVDKDRDPKWNPSNVNDVDENDVRGYFDFPAGGALDLSGIG